MKLTRHNGRSGKHGTYNPRHNDRRFDVENSEHIDAERARQNVYWDCYRGFTTHEFRENPEQPDFSFEEIERMFYYEHYGGHVEAQNARNEKTRHTERNRTVEDLLKNNKTCPEETLYQIGTMEQSVPPEVLFQIVTEFQEEFDRRFGSHVHIIDWALHLDEATPHIHERHVFDCENRYGELCPQQEKALEELGVPLPKPDKPKGRGMELSFSPVKELALASGLPVYQPVKMRDGTAYEEIKALSPDILVVVAYGRILPDEILALPKYGAVNVHGSLLPKYRGAAPIQWAVLNGDKVTGVSTMYLASEMDTGDVIYTAETEIGEFETSGELFDRLMVMGAQLLAKTLRDIEKGIAPRTPQDHSKASYVSQLDKSLSPIDWNKSPRSVVKWIYGLQPWPVATMEMEGKTYRVFAAEYTDNKTHKAPGQIVAAGEKGIEVACGDGETVLITQLQAPGKKRMAAADFLRGHPIKPAP